MLNTFGTTKIDKLRFVYKKSDLSEYQKHKLDKKIRLYFHDGMPSNKAGHIMYRFTPTKLVTPERKVLNHNIQMPSERVLKDVFEDITLSNYSIQNDIWCTELHLAKDIILKNAVNDYLIELANRQYQNLDIGLLHSNIDAYSLYIHSKHNIDSDEKIKFIIKFYDKAKEFYKKNNTYICQLHEPLSQEDINQVGSAYNPKDLTLDLSKINLMRVEIELHRKNKLQPVLDKLSHLDEFLSVSVLIKALKSGTLYDKLEKVFNNLLKECVFDKENVEPTIENISMIRQLTAKLLSECPKFYYYRAIAREQGLMEQFKEISKISEKFRISDLYQELYNKLFITNKEEIEPENLKSDHSSSSSEWDIYLFQKYYELVYSVLNFDTS